MSDAENIYAPPRVLSANGIPTGVLNYLNGEDLLSKTRALRLSTVDPDGWPKAALISAGDVLALPNGHLRLAIFAGSGTAANLVRDGRLTLSMALDRAGGKHRPGQVSGALPVKAGGPGEIRGGADDPAAATKLKLEYAESLPKGIDHGGCGRLMTIGSYWKIE
jgi:hypothetical protein